MVIIERDDERAELGFGRASSLFTTPEAAPADALIAIAAQLLPALPPPNERVWNAELSSQFLLLLANAEGMITRLRELRVRLANGPHGTFGHELMASLDARSRLAARVLDAAGNDGDPSPAQQPHLERLLEELPQAALRLAGCGCAAYPAVAVALFGAAAIAALCGQGARLVPALRACREYFAACVDPARDGSLADNAEVRATAASNLHYAMEGVPKFGLVAEEQVAPRQWRTTYGVIGGSPESGYAGRAEAESGERSNRRGWLPFPGTAHSSASLDTIVAYLNRLRGERALELEQEHVLRRHCRAVACLVDAIDKVLGQTSRDISTQSPPSTSPG